MKVENIKFKAKRLDGKGWVCGYFYEENGNTYIIENRQKESKLNRNLTYQVDPSTVCQFTGLKDKNGVEVWEHDLLTKDYSVIYEVGYEGCGFKASIKGEDEFDLNLVAVCKYDCICGNKFDRKEGEKNDEEKNI
jgi:uncharacterized phage protein (TIGR01671 family)|nr:MAG TPA_asm: YopX protein [Caudoviricetes sp.]